MEPSSAAEIARTAELARTMASGHLIGVVHLRGHPDRLRVRHAIGRDGHPLLLTRRTGQLAGALQPGPDAAGVPAVLSVDDLPPVLGAPCHGRLWMSGRAAPLTGPAAKAAALVYAETSPCSDLLDLGRGHALYRLEVADVRLAGGTRMVEVDLDDYLAARPDPLHRDESRLLAALAAYDGRRLRELYLSLTGTRPPPGARAVRIDRFGLVLTVPGRSRTLRRLRLDFPTPVVSCPASSDYVHDLISNSAHNH